MDERAAPRPLPVRPSRPLVVHWVIDSAAVFLLTVLVALFLGASVVAIAVVAAALGLMIAPWTRRREARGLAERADRRDPSASEPGP